MVSAIQNSKNCFMEHSSENSIFHFSIIKAETNRLKGPTNTTINNYQNSPEAFNKYLSSITENIIHDIKCKNKQGYNINKDPNYYFLNLFLV
jgi:hypothetical protein